MSDQLLILQCPKFCWNVSHQYLEMPYPLSYWFWIVMMAYIKRMSLNILLEPPQCAWIVLYNVLLMWKDCEQQSEVLLVQRVAGARDSRRSSRAHSHTQPSSRAQPVGLSVAVRCPRGGERKRQVSDSVLISLLHCFLLKHSKSIRSDDIGRQDARTRCQNCFIFRSGFVLQFFGGEYLMSYTHLWAYNWVNPCLIGLTHGLYAHVSAFALWCTFKAYTLSCMRLQCRQLFSLWYAWKCNVFSGYMCGLGGFKC